MKNSGSLCPHVRSAKHACDVCTKFVCNECLKIQNGLCKECLGKQQNKKTLKNKPSPLE